MLRKENNVLNHLLKKKNLFGFEYSFIDFDFIFFEILVAVEMCFFL